MAYEETTVEYRDVPGFPGYRVGDDGSVWSICGQGSVGAGRRLRKTWKILRASADSGCHLRVTLYRRSAKTQLYVHRLVLVAFVGPCLSGQEACHNNGIPFDNRLENLRWDSHSENQKDTVRHGVRAIGSAHRSAKLTEAQVVEIREKYAAGGASHRQLAAEYGVAKMQISYITRHVTWKHVP